MYTMCWVNDTYLRIDKYMEGKQSPYMVRARLNGRYVFTRVFCTYREALEFTHRFIENDRNVL